MGFENREKTKKNEKYPDVYPTPISRVLRKQRKTFHREANRSKRRERS